MSELIERVALAICASDGNACVCARDNRIAQTCHGSMCEFAVRAARLAIEAIREPTEKMTLAADEANLDIYWSYRADGRPGGPGDVFRCMIDAALAD